MGPQIKSRIRVMGASERAMGLSVLTLCLADPELYVVVVRCKALRAGRRDVGVAAHQAAQLPLQSRNQSPDAVAEALRLQHLHRVTGGEERRDGHLGGGFVFGDLLGPVNVARGVDIAAKQQGPGVIFLLIVFRFFILVLLVLLFVLLFLLTVVLFFILLDECNMLLSWSGAEVDSCPWLETPLRCFPCTEWVTLSHTFSLATTFSASMSKRPLKKPLRSLVAGEYSGRFSQNSASNLDSVCGRRGSPRVKCLARGSRWYTIVPYGGMHEKRDSVGLEWRRWLGVGDALAFDRERHCLIRGLHS